MTEQNGRELRNPEFMQSTATKKELLALGYESFGYSQGSQKLQLHVIQAVIRRMIEEGYVFDMSVLTEIKQRMAGKQPPIGHNEVPTSEQKSSQMQFWGRNLLTVVTTNIDRNPAALPSRKDLEEQAWQTGGTPEMSSYSDEELTKLTAAFDAYREDGLTMSSYDVMANLLLPELIRTEDKWQTTGRPRTDTSDRYESVWRRYSQAAHTKVAQEKPLTVRDQLYLDMAGFMERAEINEPESELIGNYWELLDTYNANHETVPVAALYK